jgi:hypothetical protein
MSEGRQAGWYRDPEGGTGQRYWDGDRWTDRERDAAPSSSPSSADSQPMTRVAIQKARRAKQWRRVLAGVALLVVLGVGGYAVLSGGGSSTSGNHAAVPSTKGKRAGTTSTSRASGTTVPTNPPTPRAPVTTLPLSVEQSAHAISQAQFDSVALGTGEGDVVKLLAKPPQNPQVYVVNHLLKQSEVKSTCLYYNKIGASFGPGFQFCFTSTGLQNKKAF